MKHPFETAASEQHIHFLASNDEQKPRELRRKGLSGEVVINGRVCKLHDWSRSGASFEISCLQGFQPGDNIELVLRFHALHGVVQIPLEAKVARTGHGKAAVKFRQPLPLQTKRLFDAVIDSLHAQSFLESQRKSA